ncbi:hypothetical protein HYX06_02030 [Candidatus Woesearchaeota archaeon]|nr:hypothetical protein [Candidatus Woesearchaeota archaeon]
MATSVKNLNLNSGLKHVVGKGRLVGLLDEAQVPMKTAAVLNAVTIDWAVLPEDHPLKQDPEFRGIKAANDAIADRVERTERESMYLIDLADYNQVINFMLRMITRADRIDSGMNVNKIDPRYVATANAVRSMGYLLADNSSAIDRIEEIKGRLYRAYDSILSRYQAQRTALALAKMPRVK